MALPAAPRVLQKFEPYVEVSKFDCKQRAIRAVRFNSDGNYCMSCGSDKSLKLWNPHRALLLQTYSGHGYEVLDVQGSCDNAQMVSCSADKNVIVWDVASAKTVRKIRAHAGRINCVKYNEESTVVFSGSIDCTVKAWDLRSKSVEPMQSLDEAKDTVMSLFVSDHEVLTGSVDGRMRRYDLRVGKLYTDCLGSSVTSVCFSRDGQCVLTSTLDNTVRLMDKDTGEMLNEYVGHSNSEYKIDSCLNDSDTVVFSGSEDGRVMCWDLLEGKVLCQLKHHSSRTTVHSLSHHPTQPCLVVASQNVLHVWKHPKQDGATT